MLGYVLKRWWDNADALVEHRKEAYSKYFTAAYTYAKDIMHNLEDGEAKTVVKSYEDFQVVSPNFQLHASPTALAISDEFFFRCKNLRDADRSTWSDQEQGRLVDELSKGLSVLREALKVDLYRFQPMFFMERVRFNKKWRALIKENEKRNTSSDD